MDIILLIGFTNFHRDRYTSLPDVSDRLLGTSVTATWDYNSTCLSRPDSIDFNKVRNKFE